MDKATLPAVEWLERNYDEWETQDTIERRRGLRFTTVVNAWQIADTRVSAWSPPMFTIKDDIGDRVGAIRTNQEAEELYWCSRCSWKALIGRAYSHACWKCSRRISHMLHSEVGWCEQCETEEYGD